MYSDYMKGQVSPPDHFHIRLSVLYSGVANDRFSAHLTVTLLKSRIVLEQIVDVGHIFVASSGNRYDHRFIGRKPL